MLVSWAILLSLFLAQCFSWPCSWPLLYQGSISPPQVNNTKALQFIFNDRYGSNLSVTGTFDTATTNAVKQFQRLHGLQQDGMMGPNSWSILVDFTITAADNSAIGAAEVLLGIPGNGNLTPAFVKAVREFQMRRGLPVTGQVALSTWHTLISGCNSSMGTAVYGFDIGWPEGLPTQDQLFCLLRAGFSFAIFEVYTEGHRLWTQGIKNILNAHTAGFPFVNAYHFPLRSEDPVQQVQTVANAMNNASIYWVPRVWLDVEGDTWKAYTKEQNVVFLRAMRETYEKSGFHVGIYVGREYPSIFGDYTGFSDLPVWYAHYDNVPSFVDWWGQPYGGWKAPSVKQFWDKAQGIDKACGVNTDWDWSPNSYPFM